MESFDVGAGDYILCFSDGVSGNLALNEIARLVSACEGQSAEVAACVDIHICVCTHMPCARHGTRTTADGPNPDTDSNPDAYQVVARTIVAAAKNAKLIADDVTAVAVRANPSPNPNVTVTSNPTQPQAQPKPKPKPKPQP